MIVVVYSWCCDTDCSNFNIIDCKQYYSWITEVHLVKSKASLSACAHSAFVSQIFVIEAKILLFKHFKYVMFYFGNSKYRGQHLGLLFNGSCCRGYSIFRLLRIFFSCPETGVALRLLRYSFTPGHNRCYVQTCSPQRIASGFQNTLL